MSRSTKAWFANTGLMLAAVVSIGVSWLGIAQIVAMDVLARFRRVEGRAEQPGIQMIGTEFSYSDGEKLLTQGTADRVDIAKDRSRVSLFKVRNGVFYADQNQKFKYTCNNATYVYFYKRLQVNSETRVIGKDIDIKTEDFTFDERNQKLTVPGELKGRLFSGQATAKNLVYNLKTGHMLAGPVSWKGELADPLQGTKTEWKFDADDVEFAPGKQIYLKGTATDGKSLIKADRIEHDTKTGVITCIKNVRYWGEEANLSGPRAVIYTKEKRLVASEGVNLLIKPESQRGLKEEPIPPLIPFVPDSISASRPPAPSPAQQQQKEKEDEIRSPKTIRDYPVTIIAKEIEYFYKKGSRKANIKGSPQARQEMSEGRWRMVWAHSAIYDGEGDWLTLQSRGEDRNVRLKTSLGDDYKAIEFKISTKKDDERMFGKKATGTSLLDDEDGPPATTGGGTGSTGGNIPPSLSGGIGRKKN